jgi:CRP-like cAMP-binding protein
MENRLFSRLDDLSGGVLKGLAHREELATGSILAKAGNKIDRIVFPWSGLISLHVDVGGKSPVEVAMVGRNGALGSQGAFGECYHVANAICQTGGVALSLAVGHVGDLAQSSKEARDLLVHQAQRYLAEASLLAGCAAVHSASQRVASWMLRAMDAAGSSELWATQEIIAGSLGLQRASVTSIARHFSEKGAITYRRGRIRIADPELLVTHACGCQERLARQKQLF